MDLNKKPLNILYVTNMYPYESYKYFGIHVKEQIDSIKESFQINPEVYFINGRRSIINYLISIIKINYLIAIKSFDIIHIHFGLSGLFLIFNPFIKRPVVLTLHGSDVNTTNILFKWIVNKVASKCNKIIIVNPEMAIQMKSFDNNLEVIPCGVDINLFRPNRPPITNPKSSFKIGFPGDPARIEKNYKLFCNVISLLTHSGCKVEVIIFHQLTRNQVADRLNTIDVLLLTSFNEGSPQIVKEALACNTSVVSVPVGDVSKLLKDLDNCIISKSFEPEELCQAVLQVIAKNNISLSHSLRDRITVLNYDLKSIANRIYNSYKTILNA